MSKKIKYSLHLDTISDFIDSSLSQQSICREKVSESIDDYKKDSVTALACECFAINTKFVNFLEEVLLYGEDAKNYDPQQENRIILDDNQTVLLETVIVVRHKLQKDLAALNNSILLH